MRTIATLIGTTALATVVEHVVDGSERHTVRVVWEGADADTADLTLTLEGIKSQRAALILAGHLTERATPPAILFALAEIGADDTVELTDTGRAALTSVDVDSEAKRSLAKQDPTTPTTSQAGVPLPETQACQLDAPREGEKQCEFRASYFGQISNECQVISRPDARPGDSIGLVPHDPTNTVGV